MTDISAIDVVRIRDDARCAIRDLLPGDPSDTWSQEDVYTYFSRHLDACVRVCNELLKLRGQVAWAQQVKVDARVHYPVGDGCVCGESHEGRAAKESPLS